MRRDARNILNKLNNNFYAEIGQFWNQESDYFWDGWYVMKHLLDLRRLTPLKVLDIGCGNGRFATFASTHLNSSQPITYLGIDNSAEMLSFCPAISHPHSIHFSHIDVVESAHWNRSFDHQFNLVVLMGLMHHIPSFQKRLNLITSAAQCLTSGGYLCFTTWRFDLIPRLQKRVVNLDGGEGRLLLSELGLSRSDLEAGDALLNWVKYERAYRYSHQYSEQELAHLIKATGCTLVARYLQDGKECMRNEYFVLRKP